jgi:SAM-dependent methyltransferase
MTAPPLAPQGRLRWYVVRRLVRRLGPSSILEIGCGLGGVGARLATMAGYTAAEPDEQSWSVAHGRIAPLGGEVVHGNHDVLADDRTFDLVCAFEVLEHIEDDAAAMRDWLAKVRPGGHLLLSVPADQARFGPADTLVGHHRRYGPVDLRDRLAAAGAVDIDIRRYGWPLGFLLESVRNRMATRRMPGALTSAEERTRTSGRTFQPRAALAGTVIQLGVAPFALLQDLRPNAGPGLIALARRPDGAPHTERSPSSNRPR